ncbi:MAG TPA: hypothetical protein VJ873_07690 [bacterium]|nr:hypothetical protein [bacterium]
MARLKFFSVTPINSACNPLHSGKNNGVIHTGNFVQPPTPSNNDRLPRRSHSPSSERKRKEYFHFKLMEGSKKPQSSNSLFWDWSRDVKDSTQPNGKNK